MKTRIKHVPLFISVTNESVPYLAVTLKSVSENLKGERTVDVRVLTSCLAPYNQRKIRHMNLKGIEISIVDVNSRIEDYRADLEERLGGFYGEESFYPFFIAEMYPRISKAMYVECGTLIREDIGELYDAELGDGIIGGVLKNDEVEKRLTAYRDSWVGVESDKYVDISVLLMNFTLLRKYRIEDRFIRLLTGYNFDTVSAAGDYMNFLCKGRVIYLDSIWKTSNKDAGAEKVVSFAPYRLPWHYVNISYADEFWDIARRTAFYEDVRDNYISFNEEERMREKERFENMISHAQRLVNANGGFRLILGDNYLL